MPVLPGLVIRVPLAAALVLWWIILPVRADEVLWEYDLSELPPGWTISEGEWLFQPDGAHAYAEAEAMSDEWNTILTTDLILPDGTDSVGITAGQASYAWSSGLPDTFAFNRLIAILNGQGYILWNNSQGHDSLSIDVSLSAARGDTVVFVFLLHCSALSYPDGPRTATGPSQIEALAEFHVWDFVLTAYGDLTTPPAHTWGSIKIPY